MPARPTTSTPHLPPPDDVESIAARTADLVLKLAALAERYEAGAGSAERAAVMRDAVRAGRRHLVVLAGVDAGGLAPAPSRVRSAAQL